MADRRDAPDEVVEHWKLARPAGRAAVLRAHGEPAVVAGLATPNALRANQLPPDGDWSIWVILAGRGFGKTRAGADWMHARLPGAERSRARRRLLGGETRVGAVELSFYDEGRDYQPGLQRARRDAAGPVEQRAIACAMTPAGAKSLAAALLARSEAARWQTSIRLPWRHLGLGPGDRLRLENEPGVWRVRQTRFESFIVHLELERVDSGGTVLAASDGGRVVAFEEQPAGPTSLAILDLPPLPGDLPSVPRLWIAAAGASPGWRRATIEVSADVGTSYSSVGLAAAATPMGVARTILPAGPLDRWDRFSRLDVELLSDSMWLEGRPEASVLAGTNMALVGGEIIQFASAEALAPRQFRLSGLLRGRLGTEHSVSTHAADVRFVLLDRGVLLPFDPPVDAVGRSYRFRPAGSGDLAAVSLEAVASGTALRPLAPAHLRLSHVGGDVVARWVRRSRAGFGWSDFVDAPLAEASEAYRIDITLDGRPVRSVNVMAPEHLYTAADRAADGGGAMVGFAVAQLSAAVGPGSFATAALHIQA